jgi:galactitol-specific phosphotransferase system IIB component
MATDTENWDDMSDEDFMSAIDDASYEPIEEDEQTNEDTDFPNESEPEDTENVETNEQIDDDAQDSTEPGFEDDDYEEEENSQAEKNSEEDQGSTDNGNETYSDEEAENNTDETNVGDEGKEAAETDYKAEYAKILEEKNRYENFYNEVTGEFVANGRKTRGFDDPKKIIEAQQMAAGYSDKMAAFKKYRPFMNTLKEKGMLDSPDKFNLAMQLLEGDPEAIKKQLKDLEIDPFEMDMDNIDYVQKNQVSTDIEIALDDVMESAGQYGVDAEVQEIITNDWDDQSVIELLEDPQNSADLIDHINSGAYEVVLDRVAEKKRSDGNGVYGNKPSIEQYREAVIELENEYVAYMQNQQNQPGNHPAQTGDNQEWIGDSNYVDPAKAQEQEAYKAKVNKQNAKTDEARRKATSLSKKKRGTRKPKKAVDPLSMDDEKFTEYLDSMIYQ